MGLYLSAYCGGTLVVLPRYHPLEVLQALVEERITIFPGSPTLFTGLMANEVFAATDLSRIHTCYSGSAPLPEETLRRWEQAVGAPVYEGYGQTEAGPVLTFNPVNGARKPGSVGVPVAGTDIQIVDAESGTRVLPAGEKGEIRARGPQIMSGYCNRPEETATALREGWLYTGDIGELDADGYLSIRDRKKDMVIVGGYNVYPREVDEVLAMHSAVQEAAAVGAPDAYRGEVVRAFVVLRPGAVATPADIIAHCAKNLARYKVPVSVAILDALPRTTVNKTDKNALRERAAKHV
jgi:long-chain acyl-CoA synthetase